MAVRQVAGPIPRRLAAAFRAGGKQVPGQIRRGFQSALAPLGDEVKRQATAKFPSGYAPAFVASAQTRISLSGRGGTVTAEARIFATGRQERRDVIALNNGILRHPVHGFRRRRLWTTTKPRRRIPGGQLIANPWVAQSIPGGFGDEAVGRSAGKVDAAMSAVLDAVEATITGA